MFNDYNNLNFLSICIYEHEVLEKGALQFLRTLNIFYFEMFLTFLKPFFFRKTKLCSVHLERYVTTSFYPLYSGWMVSWSNKAHVKLFYIVRKMVFALVRNKFYCCNNYKLLVYVMLI